MNRTALKSSIIASCGYYDDSCTLEIEFRKNGIYQYFDVPHETFQQLEHALSPDDFFRERIRGTYRYARV